MNRPAPRALRWTALLFALGSTCFAAAAITSQWASAPRPGIGVTFFVGSILFTIAAALQLHGARDVPSAIQLAGTLFFNISTFAGMKHGFDARQTDLRVWTPDVAGSICFLVSSGMAYAAARSSRIAALNLLGSVAFGLSAVTALVEPSTGEPVSAAIANATTTIGALCFLAGAIMLVPDSARQGSPAGR
jgi:hypothetical protein